MNPPAGPRRRGHAPLSSDLPLPTGLHPRSRHAGRYNFSALVQAFPNLEEFLRSNPAGDHTIDFSDPAAVTALNAALLRHHYGVTHWDLPPGYLCPPIPGRADYLHHLADLLAGETGSIPRGPRVAVLDIGLGANCVYPIIGVREYDWRFVGSDIDPVALAAARRIVAAHPHLTGRVECRLQPASSAIFKGVVRPGESFAASMCNPPFHASRAEAAAGTSRKLRNLHGTKSARPVLNFGGQSHELWCEGGERAFVCRMIRESVSCPELCQWFTTLVSKRDNLPPIERALKEVGVSDVRIIDLAHGQKQSRIVAWRFVNSRGGSRTRPTS